MVRSIFEDKSENLWFGTEGGLSCYHESQSNSGGILGPVGTFTSFYNKEGRRENWVCSFFQDKSENLWFGTNGGGSESV